MDSSDVLGSLAQTTTNFAISAVMLAVLTAIFLQALYELGLRAGLQRQWVSNWIKGRLLLIDTSLKDDPWSSLRAALLLDRLFFKKDPDQKNVHTEVGKLLAWLEGQGREKSLYSLSYQQLCGQIASLVHGEINGSADDELIGVFALEPKKGMYSKQAPGKEEKSPPMRKTRESKAARRERLLFLAEKGIDELQIYLGRLWRMAGYIFNLLFSFGLALFLWLLSTQFNPLVTGNTWLLLSVGAAGGLIAPIANTVLERLFSPR